MQDSIIVYRNPMEKALWEGLMSGNGTFTFILVFIVVAVLSFAIFYNLFVWMAKRMGFNAYNSDAYCGIAACLIAGVLAFWVGYLVL